MSRRNLSVLCVAIITMASSLSASHAFAQQKIVSQDIAGIQIGVPFSFQKDLIAEVNPGFTLTDMTENNLGKKVIGIRAVATKGSQSDQMIVLYDDAGIVWFVGRSQNLEAGSRIKRETLFAALKDKYGENSPGEPKTVMDMKLWAFDRQGVITSASGESFGVGARQFCYNEIHSGLERNFTVGNGHVGIFLPVRFSEKCGVLIQSFIKYDSETNLVSGFSVRIIDAKRMYDQLSMAAVKEAAERDAKIEQEKNKNIKPSL
jgi:hypothetical protein